MEIEGLLRKIDLTGAPFQAPQISSAQSLDEQLPLICAAIFERLTSRQLEATYQRCLAIELESATVQVKSEVSIQLTYKGVPVGTRRADLVLTTADGSQSIVELKAVAGLTCDHLKQLEFYLHHFGIDRGYLINFPHDSGFPEASDASGTVGSVFQQQVLSGVDPRLSDRVMRGQHADDTVQVIRVTRLNSSSGQSAATPAAPPCLSSSPRAAVAHHSRAAVVGKTKSGADCKVCLKATGGFCKMHLHQAPGSGDPDSGSEDI